MEQDPCALGCSQLERGLECYNVYSPCPEAPSPSPSFQPILANIPNPLLVEVILVFTVTGSRTGPRIYWSYTLISSSLSLRGGGDGERETIDMLSSDSSEDGEE